MRKQADPEETISIKAFQKQFRRVLLLLFKGKSPIIKYMKISRCEPETERRKCKVNIFLKNASYYLEPMPIVPCPPTPKRANTKHLNGNGLKSPDKAMC